MGAAAIRIYALCVLLSGINMVSTYYYQALGKEFISYLIFTLRGLVFFLAFSLLLSRWGVELFWWTSPCMEAATLLVLCLYNRRKGSWTYLEEDDGRIFTAFLDSRTADLGAVERAVSGYLEGMDASPAQSYFAAIAVEEVCGVILDRGFVVSEGYALDTDGISLEKGRGLDALGIKMIKSKAKEFFYRRYAGFNTLVVRV